MSVPSAVPADPPAYPEPEHWPGLSVVVAINDDFDPQDWLERLLVDPYPGPFEVVLAVAMSATTALARAEALAHSAERLTVLVNSSGRLSTGLNAAVFTARYPIVARLEPGSVVSNGYFSIAVAGLLSTGADTIGGIMSPRGSSPVQRSIARAMSIPLGIGGARFHVGGQRGPTRSVYLGVYRSRTLERLGGYSERFDRAQDWELNHRIRRSGGTIWFEPSMRATYSPPATLWALGVEFAQSGRWRREVVRRYPESVNRRYLAPPCAVAVTGVGLLLAIVGLLCSSSLLAIIGLVPLVGYLVSILIGSIPAGRSLSLRSRLLLPFAVIVMHVSWGCAFLFAPPARRDHASITGSR